MKSGLSFIAIILLAYIGICIFLYVTQRSAIYYPVPETKSSVAFDLRFDTGSEYIKVWRVGEPGEHAILYFGGNAENVAQNIDQFEGRFQDHTVYLVNYRGYGGSTGEPSESALYDDALFLFDYLAKQHASVSVVGRSLGSGVATYLAAQRRVSRLVLVSPFDSILRIAEEHFRFFPVGLILLERFDSVNRAQMIRSPTLVLVAGNDEVIPRSHTDQLIEAITNAPVTIEVITGATHNTIANFHQYMDIMAGFMQEDTD